MDFIMWIELERRLERLRWCVVVVEDRLRQLRLQERGEMVEREERPREDW